MMGYIHAHDSLLAVHSKLLCRSVQTCSYTCNFSCEVVQVMHTIVQFSDMPCVDVFKRTPILVGADICSTVPVMNSSLHDLDPCQTESIAIHTYHNN